MRNIPRLQPTSTASKKEVARFRRYIFSWWRTHRRDLPWRHTQDPYCILVSEVMLQQTQVARVLPKYQEFLKAFPTVYDLAGATPGNVLRLWRGMGYNRRALYLQRTARSIVHDYQGIFPQSEQELVQLPGLGKYTARALLVFAYKQDVAMIDTNIRQIITRFFFEGKTQKEPVIQKIADQLAPKGKSWEWHQALMDYGALALHSSVSKRQVSPEKHLPFKDSNRFYRGRIVDRLRDGEVTENELLLDISRQYKRDKVFIRVMIQGLLSDGLIEKTKSGVFHLPD